MPPSYLPYIAKACLQGLTIQITRSGLALGDPIGLVPLEDGRIGALAQIRAPLFGFLPRARQTRLIGHFDAESGALLARGLARSRGLADGLRLRIVGLTPEFLAGPAGPEVAVSVWLRV